MYMIFFRLICEILSRIAVKINFLWGRNMLYTPQRHLLKLSSRDIYVTICKILLQLSYVSLIDYNMYKVLTLKIYTALVHLHGVTNFLNHKTISSKQVSIFHHENMKSFLNYIIIMIRALFA